MTRLIVTLYGLSLFPYVMIIIPTNYKNPLVFGICGLSVFYGLVIFLWFMQILSIAKLCDNFELIKYKIIPATLLVYWPVSSFFYAAGWPLIQNILNGDNNLYDASFPLFSEKILHDYFYRNIISCLIAIAMLFLINRSLTKKLSKWYFMFAIVGIIILGKASAIAYSLFGFAVNRFVSNVFI